MTTTTDDSEHDFDFPIPLHEREAIAARMLAEGVRPKCSTGIHGYITRGYGTLDQFGFWEYPLPDGEFVE